jgi:geranylgeranyl transferase type-2 subunit alpha
MHGRPRVKDLSTRSPEAVAAAEKKAALFGQLCGRVLQARKDHEYGEESLKMSEKLLEMNPEMYTVWNYRREYLAPILEGGGDVAVEAVTHELGLTEKALMKNPKSYSTFHHRKWIVSSGFCSLEHELVLVEKLLDADERNFHGWGYRRAIARMMGLPTSRELEFSRQKIEENFSNYSAWHHRTTILPRLASLPDSDCTDVPASGPCVSLDILKDEFQFVRQTFYIDPVDQSGWFYHRWLVGCLAEHVQGEGKDGAVVEIIEDEVAMCKDVHELEPDAKWPILTMVQLQKFLKKVNGTVELDVQNQMIVLQEMDPMRRNVYADVCHGEADPWYSLDTC